jgi:arsenate reductase (thioredoxin)
MTKAVLFLCPHGAAKSVLAAAYFQRLARERGLPYEALSAGTEPEQAVAPAVVAHLRAEGLPVPIQAPRTLTDADLQGADRIVSLGCDLAGRLPAGRLALDWSDVPPVSAGLPAARHAILVHVEKLLAALAASDDPE